MITTATVTRQGCSFLGKQSLKPGSSWALATGGLEGAGVWAPTGQEEGGAMAWGLL